MNSLQDLNGFSNTAIVYQTAATGNVVISTPVNTTQMMPDYTNKFEWPVGMEVLQTGNVANVNYYTISMPVDPGLANVSQAVSWPNLPNTFTITRSGYVSNTGTYDYQVKGPITTTNWNLIKSPVIQMGNTYNLSNTVMSANVYINSGNTASHTMTLYFPYDVAGSPTLSYQEDVIANLPGFSVSTNADATKIYQCTVTQDPVIGNLIIGNTYYGGEVTVTGNLSVVNTALANLQFLGNANSFANTTLYYNQKQVTNGIQQARDYPVALNSTGDFFDAPISGGFRLLDSSGNYTSTANVTSTDFYYNQFPYFEAVGNGKAGTGNTVSNVAVSFPNPAGWDQIYTIGNVITITPNAFSTGNRYQNYYAMIGFVDPGPATAEQSWTAVVTATTTGNQVSSRTFTAFKYSDDADFTSSQTDYAALSGTTYRQGRRDTTLYTVDLPWTQANTTFTLTSSSNVQVNVRHYPSFGYEKKELDVGPFIFFELENLGVVNYNLDTNTFSPALNAGKQAFWDSISLNISLGNTTILSKANGTSSVSTVASVANITALCSATTWGNAQTINIPLTQSMGNVSSTYFTSGGASWISITIPMVPRSIDTTLQYGPNFAPAYGNSGSARNFASFWSRI